MQDTGQMPTPFQHWMLREIYEQPETLRTTLQQYVREGAFREDTCAPVKAWLRESTEIVIAASGSSRHAGMLAEILVEDRSGMHVDVEYASEYTFRSERAMKSASVVVISQSGETADTLAALRRAKGRGSRTMAITNVAGSSMATEADVAFGTLAGRERAIPATKSFTAQLINVSLLSLMAAEVRGTLSAAEIMARLKDLESLPAMIETQLAGWEDAVREVSDHYRGLESMLFLGRDVHYPMAREGALKLKESAYLHAEGYPSGELKHGPNALVGEGTSLVMLATVERDEEESERRYEKVLALMRDMRTQGAKILAIANAGDTVVESLATQTIFVKPAPEGLLPFCEVIPMQMLAYVMAVKEGIDVDRPRNLSKAVLAD
jgi:glucosamine--fructose-6-phosphate aminotransferase (isomerizing)